MIEDFNWLTVIELCVYVGMGGMMCPSYSAVLMTHCRICLSVCCCCWTPQWCHSCCVDQGEAPMCETEHQKIDSFYVLVQLRSLDIFDCQSVPPPSDGGGSTERVLLLKSRSSYLLVSMLRTNSFFSPQLTAPPFFLSQWTHSHVCTGRRVQVSGWSWADCDFPRDFVPHPLCLWRSPRSSWYSKIVQLSRCHIHVSLMVSGRMLFVSSSYWARLRSTLSPELKAAATYAVMHSVTLTKSSLLKIPLMHYAKWEKHFTLTPSDASVW